MIAPAAPRLALLAALDRGNGIGRGNALPWHLPDDLRRFKALTLGKPLLMGRKTAESLGRALPGLVATLVLATIGFVAVGTILSAMVVRTRFAELMLPVLILPFMVPPLIGAVQVTARLLGGRPLTEVLGWLRLLVTYDLVFVTLCTLAFTAVVDE